MTESEKLSPNAWHLHDSEKGGRGWLASMALGDGIAGLAGLDFDPETGLIGGQVDHVIADPPYEKEAHANSRRTRVRGGQGSEVYPIDFDAITDQQRNEFGEAIRRACTGWSIVFCQVEAVEAWRHAIGAERYRRCCIWVKPDSTPQLTGDRPAQAFECFVCHWHGPGRSTWNAGGKRGVYTHNTTTASGRRGSNNSKEHPTQKPIALMRELIQDFTREGDVVADPFAGSGSTGVACLSPDRYGIEGARRFLGWELKPEYFDTACRRLASRPRAVKDQEELFR